MPHATLASRALKNNDTGLDLFVPAYKETKGIVSNIVHYQVVLVSNLTCFKAPSHKDSDVVQYSVEKKFGEFEDLRNKISELFSGTALPPLNKKSLIVNEQVLRDRRNSLESFMKLLASTKKLSTCQPLLEFLGVDSIRAKKFSRGEFLDHNLKSSKQEQDEEVEKTPDNDQDFFQDEEEKDDELFNDDTEDVKQGEESIFGSGGVSVFDGQDLKRELTEEDEADFSFVPNAIISKKVTTTNLEIQERKEIHEDNTSSDLFEFDDLDQLMNVNISKKSKETKQIDDSAGVSAKPKVAKKPASPSKPSIAAKPSIPSKPKPGAKPTIQKKPDSATSSLKGVGDSKKDEGGKPKGDQDFAGDLDQDDILKYLQDNSESTDDTLDLFS